MTPTQASPLPPRLRLSKQHSQMAILLGAPNPTPAFPCSPSRARRLAGALHCARCPGDGAVDFGSGVPRRDRGSARRLRGRGRLEAGGLPGDPQVAQISQTFPSLLLGPPISGGAGPHSHSSTVHMCPATESAPVQLSLRFTAPGWGDAPPAARGRPSPLHGALAKSGIHRLLRRRL